MRGRLEGRDVCSSRKGIALSSALGVLKEQFASFLEDPEKLKRPEGITTGMEALDRFLFWNGIPKGALTLLTGSLGTGATSLWLDAAARTVAAGKWVAWVNRDVPLSPLPLEQRGVNLGHFVTVESPLEADAADSKRGNEKLFWLLQELMASGLFDLIGCDLGDGQLKEHQLRKLQTQARDTHVALVFLSQNGGALDLVDTPEFESTEKPLAHRRRIRRPRGSLASVYSLILNFETKRIVAERALHRPTPHAFPRSVTYARFTYHLPETSNASDATDTSKHEKFQPHSLLAPTKG